MESDISGIGRIEQRVQKVLADNEWTPEQLPGRHQEAERLHAHCGAEYYKMCAEDDTTTFHGLSSAQQRALQKRTELMGKLALWKGQLRTLLGRLCDSLNVPPPPPSSRAHNVPVELLDDMWGTDGSVSILS